ncbi:MAG TPA: hypothetical protein VGQ57_03825, partial [Polyangiaceae bacterium]|nr:hypothetical protein [Polyangiaceae bacterium]
MPLTRFILTGALLTALGCSVIVPSGPSNVAQGRYYSSGDPDYDDFFLKVYRLQIKLKDAPPRVGEPRQKVADALGVGPDPSDIRGALAKRASELKERGVRYTIGRPPSPDKPPSLLVTGNPTGKDFELKGFLEGALKGAGELKVDLTAWQKELDELSARESTLEGNLAEAFANRSESQRTEVKNNLADAQKIISLLGERTHDLDVATTDFLKALTTALGETQVEAAPSESVADDSGTHEVRDKKGKKPAPEKP